MTITASAQKFICDDIVAEKQDAKDYDVLVSPAFEIDGMMIRVILDGHHSMEAAKRDGVDATFAECDATENDMVNLILRGEIEDFMAMARVDCDYYDVATGRDIW